MTKQTLAQRGFTLIEAIITIVIIGVVAGMVGMFIRTPIQQYMDIAARADITDAADSALRRVGRDLRLALPNSIRTTASPLCLEYLPTVTGGRYRADSPGNVLDVATSVSQFDVLGGMTSLPVAGDHVVVYNLGIPGADAYSNDNRAVISAATANSITLAAAKRFPLASPGSRFQVVPNAEQAVFYVCSNVGVNGGNGTGTLQRVSAYGFNAAAPSACPTPGAAPILAQNVSACSFNYTPLINQRNGQVTMQLSLTSNNETVNLYHEVHVSNVP